jgi:hypothetical protein
MVGFSFDREDSYGWPALIKDSHRNGDYLIRE